MSRSARRLAALIAMAALAGGLTACSSELNRAEQGAEEALRSLEASESANPGGSIPSYSPPTTSKTIDVDYEERNIPTIANNLVVLTNNARSQGALGDIGDSLNDVGRYYDEMSHECMSRITRSEFRQDFLDRVLPLIEQAMPERTTATVDGYVGTATVEQTTMPPLVMVFDLSEGTGLEDHACLDDGTIDITAG